MIAVAMVAGCQVLSPSGSTPRLSRSDQPLTKELETGSGQLAYIGGDGNVYVTSVDGPAVVPVTKDATAPPEGQGLSYHRLSWSPGGQLAFAAVRRSGDSAQGRLYVVESPGQSQRLVAEDANHFFIYVYWSPIACPIGTTAGNDPCHRRLAYLQEDSEGVGLHLVTMEPDQGLSAVSPRTEDKLAGRGRPMYFSWSPDGQQLVWHAGGSSRDNGEAALAVYDLDSGRAQPLALLPGSFGAPAWSPDGDAWLGVLSTAKGDELRSVGSAETPVQVTVSATETAFSWSPRGRQVAYATRARSKDPFYGPVQVLDTDTGSTRQVTDDPFRIRAFFWSPNGERLAYLTWLDLPNEPWAQWRVIDLTTGIDRGFAAFNPTPLMRFALHSFGQYAQSHRFWSPDGRYLVYADRDITTVDRIWLVDTWADRGADPIPVDRGTLAYWSWTPTTVFSP